MAREARAVRGAAQPGDWALVTGASGGIGAALAAEAARAGYGVILAARSRDRLDTLGAKLTRAYNVPVVSLTTDLSAPGAAETLWQEASAGRRIAVLVNNAGLGHFGRFDDPEGWEREEDTLHVNLMALTVLAKFAAVTMAAAGSGRILNVASTAAFAPGPGFAVYSASKAYVLSLSEAMAEELSGKGVQVTALCPGATATGFFAADGAEGATWLSKAGMADPDRVAAAGWRALTSGRRICVPGWQNKALALVVRLVPRRVVVFVADQLLRRRG